jgi:hypothetical protein
MRLNFDANVRRLGVHIEHHMGTSESHRVVRMRHAWLGTGGAPASSEIQ